MKFATLAVVFSFAFTQVYAQINTQTCQGLDNMVRNANLLYLGVCSRNAECTQVTCSNSTIPGLEALTSTVTILPCNLPAPAINIVSLAGGQVLGNYTSSTREYNRPLTLVTAGGPVTIAQLGWDVEYSATSLTVEINGTIQGGTTALFNTTTIPVDISLCAGAPRIQLALIGFLLSVLVAMLLA